MTVGQANSMDNRKWLVLSAVSVGTFISTLSGSIVNISLPTIAHDFGVGIPEIEWIVVAYLLTAGSLLLTFGRLGDVIGYRRVYIGGFAVFTLASVLCGLSLDVGQLTAVRVLQGIGFAMIQAVAPALIASTFAPLGRGEGGGAQCDQHLHRPHFGTYPRWPPDRVGFVALDLLYQHTGRPVWSDLGLARSP